MSANKRWIAPLLFGATVSIFCFYLLLRGVNWSNVVQAWAQMDWGWALFAAGLYLLGLWMRGVRCAWLVRPYRTISVKDGTQLVWIGYAANNILPARLGELVRSYALTRKEKLDYGISLSTLLVERILDGLAIVGILWVAGGFISRQAWIDKIAWFAGGIFVSAILVVLMARLWTSMFQSLLSWGAGLLPQAIGSKIESFGLRLLEGTQCLRWDLRLPGILGMSLLIWLVEGAMFAVMLVAFGWPMSWLAAYLAMSITNLGVLVPSSPGHLGVFHALCAKVLVMVGIVSVKGNAVSYAAAVHLLQIVPVTLLGLWSLQFFGFNLRSVWSLKDQEPPSSLEDSSEAKDSSSMQQASPV